MKRRTRLLLEALEDREVPATFTVLNLADNGSDSLRTAVAAANANPGADVIEFADGLIGTRSGAQGKEKLLGKLRGIGEQGADLVASTTAAHHSIPGEGTGA